MLKHTDATPHVQSQGVTAPPPQDPSVSPGLRHPTVKRSVPRNRAAWKQTQRLPAPPPTTPGVLSCMKSSWDSEKDKWQCQISDTSQRETILYGTLTSTASGTFLRTTHLVPAFRKLHSWASRRVGLEWWWNVLGWQSTAAANRELAYCGEFSPLWRRQQLNSSTQSARQAWEPGDLSLKCIVMQSTRPVCTRWCGVSEGEFECQSVGCGGNHPLHLVWDRHLCIELTLSSTVYWTERSRCHDTAPVLKDCTVYWAREIYAERYRAVWCDGCKPEAHWTEVLPLEIFCGEEKHYEAGVRVAQSWAVNLGCASDTPGKLWKPGHTQTIYISISGEGSSPQHFLKLPVAQMVKKKSACNAGEQGLISGLGRSTGGGHSNTTVFLPEESPWTEEPGGLQSMGSKRVRHDWVTKHGGVIPEWQDGKPWTRASRPFSCGLAHMRISLVGSFMIDELGP